MKFCYACGHQNNHAMRKEQREAEAERQREKKEAADTVASLKGELEEARRKLEEKDETIESQEKELFGHLDLEKVLELDDEMGEATGVPSAQVGDANGKDGGSGEEANSSNFPTV